MFSTAHLIINFLLSIGVIIIEVYLLLLELLLLKFVNWQQIFYCSYRSTICHNIKGRPRVSIYFNVYYIKVILFLIAP